MANYTVDIRTLCALYGRDEIENWFKQYNILDYLNVEQYKTIENFGVWNKDKLAKKIVDHFYMREIGFETPDLFKHYAISTMNEIMYNYLQIIYTTSLKFDPLVNVDFTESFNREINDNTSNTSNSNSNNKSDNLSLSSDTPQSNLSKVDIKNGKYATNAGSSEVSNTSSIVDNSNSNSISIEKYTRSQKGNSGSLTTAQALIKQYRDIIFNVDIQIINDLQQLFMSIY